MRTKEPKRTTTDYGMISRLSIQRDFRNAHFRQMLNPGDPEQEPEGMSIKRVISLSDASDYAPYKRFIVGKLVRIIKPTAHNGYIVEFVNDKDSDILNGIAGWQKKRQYRLDGVKFD